MNDVIEFRFYRMVDGHRVPYVMRLDRERTLLGEPVEEQRETPERPAEDPFTLQFTRWRVEGETNPFPGTDELRQMYFDDLLDLRREFEDRDEQCPACQEGRLARTYKKRLLSLL